MAERRYETPDIRVLGDLSELTQTLPTRGGSKPGIYFDYPGSSEGNSQIPPYGYPGTGTS